MVLNLSKVGHGIGLAYEAAEFATRHRRVQQRAFKVLKVTVVSMLIANVIIYGLVYFPLLVLRTANYGIATILRYDATEMALSLLSTRDAVDHFLDSLPLFGLDIVAHLRPALFDDVFFAMLEEIDPEYAHVLKTWPPKKFRWAKIKFAGQRIFKRYAMTLLVSYLSRTPYVGWMVVPAGALMMMAKFVGYPMSAAVAGLTAVSPGSKHTTMFLFKSLLAMNDFSRDLLRPYFTHLGAKPKQQVAFYHANESTIVGFILAYYFFVQLSWVGPAFYILAQGAAALFISRETVRPPVYKPGASWELTTEKEEKEKDK